MRKYNGGSSEYFSGYDVNIQRFDDIILDSDIDDTLELGDNEEYNEEIKIEIPNKEILKYSEKFTKYPSVIKGFDNRKTEEEIIRTLELNTEEEIEALSDLLYLSDDAYCYQGKWYIANNTVKEAGKIEVENRKAIRGLSKKLKVTNAALNAAIEKNIQYEEMLSDIEVKLSDNLFTLDFNPKKHEVIFHSVLSDLHIGEIVDPDTVEGEEKYNTEIALNRLNNVLNINLSKLKRARTTYYIRTGVLAVIGDIIHGEIHDYNMVGSTDMLVEDQKDVAIDAVWNYIKEYANHFEKLIVVFVSGNHGRATIKPRSAQESGTCHEFSIYKHVCKLVAVSGLTNVVCKLGKNPQQYLMIGNKKYAYHHGHKGITRKSRCIARGLSDWHIRLHKRDSAERRILGHYHLGILLKEVMINGSLLRCDAYSFNDLELPASDPVQLSFLVSPLGIEDVYYIRALGDY